jgi:hypothetical protein
LAAGSVAEIEGDVFCTGNGLAGIVGLGTIGGALAIDLPCLYRWNIPANTNIITPTMNSEKFFIPLTTA